MDADVAEIAVRLGGDLIDVRHVAAGGSYRVGTAAGVDLAIAIPGVVSFPLVSSTDAGFVVRGLPGVAASARLERGTRIELAIDRVAIAISLVAGPQPVARPRVERRPLGFAMFSLALHLAVLWMAIASEPEPATIPGVETDAAPYATRLARYAAPAQTVKREPRRQPVEVPITTEVTPTPRAMIDPPSRPRVASRGALGIAIAGRGPMIEDASADRGDRSAHHFDPASRPDFDTIKSGAYSTVATGRAVGEHYGADMKRSRLVVVSCDEASCVVIGGERAAPIRKAVERRLAEITACYRDATRGGKIELDFGVTGTGAIDDLQIGGVGDVGSCVASIFRSMHVDPE